MWRIQFRLFLPTVCVILYHRAYLLNLRVRSSVWIAAMIRANLSVLPKMRARMTIMLLPVKHQAAIIIALSGRAWMHLICPALGQLRLLHACRVVPLIRPFINMVCLTIALVTVLTFQAVLAFLTAIVMQTVVMLVTGVCGSKTKGAHLSRLRPLHLPSRRMMKI